MNDDSKDSSISTPIPAETIHVTVPALAAFNRRLYLAYRGTLTDSQLYWTYFDGRNWSSRLKISNYSSAKSPALAAFNDTLHVVHRDSHSKAIWWTYYAETDWSTAQVLPAATTTEAGALAEFQGKLYFVHKGADDAGIYYSSFDGQWSGDHAIPGALMQGTPALAVYNGVLYVMHQAADSSGQLRYAFTYNGVDWASDYLVPDVVMSESPAAAVFNGKLYVAHQGSDLTGTVNNLYHTTFDGTNWSADVYNSDTPTMRRLSSPGLGMLDGMLVWFTYGSSVELYQKIFYTEAYGMIACKVPLLDVWGEGRRVVGDLVTGFDGYQNLNKMGQQVGTGPMEIPNLVPVLSYGPPTDVPPVAFPIGDNLVAAITVMGAPINESTAREMYRVLNEEGVVYLYGFDTDPQSVAIWEKNNGNMKCIPNYQPPGLFAQPTLRPVTYYYNYNN